MVYVTNPLIRFSFGIVLSFLFFWRFRVLGDSESRRTRCRAGELQDLNFFWQLYMSVADKPSD
jgi:hypothetical protein